MSYISCSNEFRGTFKFPCLQELCSLLSFSLVVGDEWQPESCLHSTYSTSYIMTETNTFLFSKYNWSLILGRNLKTELQNIICTGTLTFSAWPKHTDKLTCAQVKRHFVYQGNVLGNFVLHLMEKILIDREDVRSMFIS